MSTDDFRITGPGFYMTRDRDRVKIEARTHVISPYKWMARKGARFWSVTDLGQELSDGHSARDIVSRCDEAPPLTRLDRAKAALEEARAIRDDADVATTSALAYRKRAMHRVEEAHDEVFAAEKEAAAATQPVPVPPPLPDALVEVARFVSANSPYDTMCLHEVWKLLARSHGVSVEALREAIK